MADWRRSCGSPRRSLVSSANASARPARRTSMSRTLARPRRAAGAAPTSASRVTICRRPVSSFELQHLGPGAHRVRRRASCGTECLARHVRADLVDGAAGDQPAVRHHGDAVGERLGFLEVVRGQHDRAAFVDELAQHLPQRFARLHVEARRWARRGTAAPAGRTIAMRELHLALLAAGKFAVRPIGQRSRATGA